MIDETKTNELIYPVEELEWYRILAYRIEVIYKGTIDNDKIFEDMKLAKRYLGPSFPSGSGSREKFNSFMNEKYEWVEESHKGLIKVTFAIALMPTSGLYELNKLFFDGKLKSPLIKSKILHHKDLNDITTWNNYIRANYGFLSIEGRGILASIMYYAREGLIEGCTD